MNERPTVIYNGDCPVCAREIGVYRSRVGPDGRLRFVDLNDADLAVLGLDRETAARRLHVLEDGHLLSGVEAFLALWRATPGFGWLARIFGLPGVRHVAGVVYEGLLAPVLYAMHRRRQAARRVRGRR